MVGGVGRSHHRRTRATTTTTGCATSPQDLLLSDPGPRDMFDDRVYKRGALTLHVLRRTIGDDDFFALLRDWTDPPPPRHGRHRRLHRPGGQLLERVTAAAVASVALLDGRPRPVTDGAATVPDPGGPSPEAAS